MRNPAIRSDQSLRIPRRRSLSHTLSHRRLAGGLPVEKQGAASVDTDRQRPHAGRPALNARANFYNVPESDKNAPSTVKLNDGWY